MCRLTCTLDAGRRAVYSSAQDEWERIVEGGEWPCALPPALYARCYS